MAKTRRGRKAETVAPSKVAPKVDESVAVPDPPSDMGQYGREYWEQLAPQLILAGILSPMHLDTFRVLCEQWQSYRSLTVWLDEDPERMTFCTESGYMQETPQVRQRDKALAALTKLWLKFGLTPHSLAQLNKQRGSKGGALPVIAQFAKRKYES